MKVENRKIIAVAILCIIALAFSLANALPSIIKEWYETVDSYRDISVVEAYSIITYQPYRNVVVLDVRSLEEYETGYIEGAINIEWTELEANLSDPTSMLWLHENDTIIVNCATGGRSANASAVLVSYEFKIVYNIVGGINAWVDAGYSLVTEAPSTYTDISVHEVYDMITSGAYPDLVILDVRTSDYDLSHIEDAINIPYYDSVDFGTRLGPLAGHENHEIIVYCVDSACTRGQLASQYLVDHNFTKVYHMLGGLEAWIAAGYPVWTPPGGQQFRITLSVGAGGTTNPTPGVHYYYEGAPVTLEAVAETGYIFDHWESAASGKFYSSSNPWNFNMPSYHFTVHAVFVAAP